MAEDKVMANGSARGRDDLLPARLRAAGIGWKVYQEDCSNFGDNILSVFKPFRPCAEGLGGYARGRSWVSEGAAAGADRTRSDGEQPVRGSFRADVARSPAPGLVDRHRYRQASPNTPCGRTLEGRARLRRTGQGPADHPEVVRAKTVFVIPNMHGDEAVGGFYDHRAAARRRR
ncbi:hypothetical protein ACRAWD_32125 [Caulobacter segnis]